MDPRRIRAPWLIVVGADAVARAGALRTLGVAHPEQLQFDHLADIPRDALSAPAIILTIAGNASWAAGAAVRAFRRSDIATPIVLWLRALGSRQRLSEFARAGYDDALFQIQGESFERTLRALQRRVDRALPPNVVRQFAWVSHDHMVQQMLGYALRNSYRKLSVSSVADWFGVWPETLNRQAKQAGLPTVHEMIGFARLLYVAHEIERGESTGSVSQRLAFKSSNAVGMFVRRWAGVSPKAMRDLGALSLAERQLRRVLGHGAHTGRDGVEDV
jgi:methylphosphotriester-DNA--protein-cysteine methyltransferase